MGTTNLTDNYLRLCVFSDEHRQSLKGEQYKEYLEKYDKIYVFLGEFPHAPGHCLLCTFGSWELVGMFDIDNLLFLNGHPNDYTVEI